LACTCQPDDSANLVDHHGALLVQCGALVDLKKELQSAYMSTNQTNFDSESFGYFKIRGDLAEVSIMKTVPNWISYIQAFFQIFPHFLSIFLARESIFKNF
jgi:hypothetical protein